MEIREELPDCHVYIYYMDIRTFGLYETKYYWKSQEEFKVKYIKARIAEVTSDGEKLIVKGEDTLVKRPITIPFDMVVHAIGMDPNVDNKDLSAVFGVDLEPHGYIDKANSYSAYRPDQPDRRVRRRRRHRPRDHRRLDRPGQGCGDGGAGAAATGGATRRLRPAMRSAPRFLQPQTRPEIERPRLDLSGPILAHALEIAGGRDRGAGRHRAVDRRAQAEKPHVPAGAGAVCGWRSRGASCRWTASPACAPSWPACAAASARSWSNRLTAQHGRGHRRLAGRGQGHHRDGRSAWPLSASAFRRTASTAGCVTWPPKSCTTSTRNATR